MHDAVPSHWSSSGERNDPTDRDLGDRDVDFETAVHYARPVARDRRYSSSGTLVDAVKYIVAPLACTLQVRAARVPPQHQMHPKFTLACGLAALPLLLAGCSDAAGPADGSRVAVRFGRSASSASLSVSTSRSAQVGTGNSGSMVVQGTNGTLTITNVSFIVAELELECVGEDDGPPGSASCAEFKAPPSFVRLPLSTGVVDVANAGVPTGSYDELEFEVENLESDSDDDASERAQIAALRSVIRAAHPDFPDRASMVVEGTFTPSGTTQPISFRTYFNAEIEVEMDMTPPLNISKTGADRALAVDVQPALWFRRADGTVMDLSRLDYTRTRELVSFALEMQRGFRKVEYDN